MLNGRLFGGADGQDFQINSGFNLIQPAPVPEPSSLILSSTGALIVLGYAWRRRYRASV
jgi:PEP-CTERM motif